MKNILQKITKKEPRKYSTSAYLIALSKRTVKKSGGHRRKNTLYIFKNKEEKQYQNNDTEDLFVVIIYLIEAFKMRLLSVAESLGSPERSNSIFK